MPLLAVFFGTAVIVLLLPLLIPPSVIPPERSVATSIVEWGQQAAPLKQDQNGIGWNAGALRAADGATDMVSLSDEREMPRQATDQLYVPAAPEIEARNERANVVEQMSPPAQPSEAAVARVQAVHPRPGPPQPRSAAPALGAGAAAGAGQVPAWQQPLKPAWQQPMKPAWQRPLPSRATRQIAAAGMSASGPKRTTASLRHKAGPQFGSRPADR